MSDSQAQAPTLGDSLIRLLNRHSAENASGTPDFILAEYMMACLQAFEHASNRREQWYGKALRIGGVVDLPIEPPRTSPLGSEKP